MAEWWGEGMAITNWPVQCLVSSSWSGVLLFSCVTAELGRLLERVAWSRLEGGGGFEDMKNTSNLK